MDKKIKVKLITVPDDAENGTLFSKRVRPNDPCPCGSGKKAKKCCGTDTKYSYGPHRNYIRREENLTEAELLKHRDGKTESRFCFEVGQSVVISETCDVEELRNKVAKVEVRGLCHDYLKPYYLIILDGEDKVYGRWFKEEDLQHLIM